MECHRHIQVIGTQDANGIQDTNGTPQSKAIPHDKKLSNANKLLHMTPSCTPKQLYGQLAFKEQTTRPLYKTKLSKLEK
jgi:hypothetical protein